MVQLGISLALASAFIANLGLLCKYRGAMAAPTVELNIRFAAPPGSFGRAGGSSASRSRRSAGALHVAALSVAPLSLVETTLSGGILLLAWIAERWFGVKVGPARVDRRRPLRDRPGPPRPDLRGSRRRQLQVLRRGDGSFEAAAVGSAPRCFSPGAPACPGAPAAPSWESPPD